MTRVLLIVALVAAVFWVFTIVDCAVQPPVRHRGVSKPVWILIVVVIPVLGGILWLVVGRARKSVLAARRAPDDDPEFLGRIGAVSDQDERIRRLEEELAQLDAEDDDPKWRTLGPPATSGGTVTPDAAKGSSTPTAPGDAAPGEPPARADGGDDDARGQRGALG